MASDDMRIQRYILALLAIRGVGPKTVTRLLKDLGHEILTAPVLDWAFTESLGIDRVLRALSQSGRSWEDLQTVASSQIEEGIDQDIEILHPLHADYPRRMLRNHNYPPILYCKGDVSCLNSEKAVAMVGTREPTPWGAKMTRKLAALLAEDDYLVVSGLALGCDSLAHEGALDVKGKTAAIVPTPLDGAVFPPENRQLAEDILAGGGVLASTCPLGMKLDGQQLAGYLVARDEWQPAMADGLIAAETSFDGGTRHALRHAYETGRPIAVFDYSRRQGVDFYGDVRFGGNVAYLDAGAYALYEPASIERFKAAMDEFRAKKNETPDGVQQSLFD